MLAPRTSRLTLALALGGLAALAGTLRAQGDAQQPRTLTVVGNGEVKAAPDLATIELAVETTAASATQATADNAVRTTAVIEALKREMGNNDRVTTTGYSLQPRYANRRPGSDAPPEITGYIASNQVRVEARDLGGVGGLIDAAITAGANRTDSLSFALENRAPYLRAALREAGAEAKAQAESIATALGVELGEVLSASSSGGYTPVPMYRTARVMAMAEAAAPPPPVEPGEVEVTATLTVTYRIE